MYFSIYRIHTDYGTYVGHTTDFNHRMGFHYNCKFDTKMSKRPIIKAIQATPDDRLKVEEIGIYEVDTRNDIKIIERYWINKSRANLNVLLVDTKNTIYHTDVLTFEHESKRERSRDDKINTNFRHNYDVLCITQRIKHMSLVENP